MLAMPIPPDYGRAFLSIIHIPELKMGLSIQEQLLKAGLVDKKQVKKADHEKRIKNKR